MSAFLGTLLFLSVPGAYVLGRCRQSRIDAQDWRSRIRLITEAAQQDAQARR